MDVAIVAAAFGLFGVACAIVIGILANALVNAKNGEADARELAAQRVGEAQVDAVKVTDANAATSAAVAAEKQQEQRGDALEKELATDASRPVGSGVDQLRAQVPGVPGAGSPGSGGAAGT